jgi:trk system potassium uptake protein
VHIVIMGCGRVGAALAHQLAPLDHTIAVIDQDRLAFRRLGDDFPGTQVAGIGFDRDTLIEAGIEEAHAFAAVSSGDNSNIISARVARETFSVTNVVARIYDPRRAEVYARLGIPTVATVRWTADEMLRRLIPEGTHSIWSDPSGHVVLAELTYHEQWAGRSIKKVQELSGARVAFVTRYGDAMLVDDSTALQDGDLLHMLVARDAVQRVTDVLAREPEERS